MLGVEQLPMISSRDVHKVRETLSYSLISRTENKVDWKVVLEQDTQGTGPEDEVVGAT